MSEKPKYHPTGEEVKAKNVPIGTEVVIYIANEEFPFRGTNKIADVVPTKQKNNPAVKIEGWNVSLGGGTSVRIVND